MKIKTVLLIVLLATVFIGIGVASYYVFFNTHDKAGNTLADNAFGWKFPITKFPLTGPGGDIAYSQIRDSGGVPQGLPVRLKIPVIGVDSAIEDALITPDGRMDVPEGSENVAWFSLGPHPGEVGSAVIGGHFGITNGVPFVFYELDKLKVGDKVYIVNDKGEFLAFIVRSIKLFNRDDDATTVFTSDDGLAHLNLITCEGIWNRINDTYPKRRVVFTDAVVDEAVTPEVSSLSDISTKAEATAIFYRTFGMGAKGMDVASLQTFLEEKKFLTMPPGIAKGFFGPLTSEAVARYQTSVGLSSVGVFGPLTRAKILFELSGDANLPNAGAEATATSGVMTGAGATSEVVKNSLTWFETLVQFIKNLYATPLDGLITSSLFILILIVLIALKNVRR